MSLVGIDNIELYSDTKCDFTPPTILLGFSFALGHGIAFFGGIQHFLLTVVQHQVVILEFLQKKKSTCPSTNLW